MFGAHWCPCGKSIQDPPRTTRCPCQPSPGLPSCRRSSSLPSTPADRHALRCVTQPDAAQVALDRLGITLPKRMRLAEQAAGTRCHRLIPKHLKPKVVTTFWLLEPTLDSAQVGE